jgi:dipeptidyl aminopeptidase/acylaminoacyl peptidase
MKRLMLLPLLWSVFFSPLNQASEAVPTLEQIMAEPDWIGREPQDPYFSPDGRFVYFQRKKEKSFETELWRLELASGEMTLLGPDELVQRDVRRPSWSPDRSQVVFERDGDVILKRLVDGKEIVLTRTSADEQQPQFVSQGQLIAFWQGDSLYVRDARGSLLEKVRLVHDKPKAESGYDPLSRQQMEFFEALRRQKADEAYRKELDKVLHRGRGFAVELGPHLKVVRRSLGPDGRYLLLVLEDDRDDEGRLGKLPHFVTTSGYVELETVRTRVGRVAPRPQRLVLIDIEQGQQFDLDWAALEGATADPLKKLRKKAVRWHKKRGASDAWVDEHLQAPSVRSMEVVDIQWSSHGIPAVQVRARDNKDRWIATVDLKEQKLIQQHRLTDEAWINWAFNEFGWLPDGRNLWFLSEESGYSHLYLRDVIKKRTRQLTRGDWEVSEPEADPSGRYIYFRANKPDPTRYDIFRVGVGDGRLEQLTQWGGDTHFVLSPDGKGLVLSHSTVLQHPELYWLPLAGKGTVRQLTHTLSEQFQSYDWIKADIVKVPSSHVSKPIYARLYKPRTMVAGKRYPAVVFVHGAGYLQNSHQGWSAYFREMMFHTFLVNHGYIVLDMDYRGSEGYGRDWRTAIYRNMGHPEVEDLKDGVAYLARQWQVDPEHVGVYGGSYGGFLTFMSMFREPDLFAAGAALRPVADWSHYNHEYTSNILNTPQLDPEAYAVSSPIEFAQGLRKPLLICSPMIDNNVFFQDSVRLVQKLIELKKTHWFQTAIYPVERHGFKQPSSWLDEYTRIFEWMERYVK